MKSLSLLALCCMPLSLLAQKGGVANKKMRVMHSADKVISFTVNNESKRGWTISPQLKPDKLEVECGKDASTVTFNSGIDSATFTVREQDVIRFYILLNGKDSALTEIVGVPRNVNFSDTYIKAHKGKIEVEIPEVHELVNIAIALTDVGLKDSNMVDMTTGYHEEVMKKFLPYKGHPLVAAMNKQLNTPNNTESYWWYYTWKMNACGFDYVNGKIVSKGIIRDMGFGEPGNPIPSHVQLLEDFAVKSGFREFYKSHAAYYDMLKSVYRELNPIDKMQGWLERYFKRQYGNYIVYFSPLIGGAHCTQRYSDNGFTQTAMFVCCAERSDKVSRAVNEMFESRVVFTEIDHNFVNPVTDEYFDEVKKVFASRGKWVDTATNAAESYGSEYAVFNEYMNWAMFSLYCMDNFNEKDYEQMLPRMERQMERGRGFIRFKAFNRKLMALYRADKKVTVDGLYKEMLVWCEREAG